MYEKQEKEHLLHSVAFLVKQKISQLQEISFSLLIFLYISAHGEHL